MKAARRKLAEATMTGVEGIGGEGDGGEEGGEGKKGKGKGEIVDEKTEGRKDRGTDGRRCS